MKLIDPIHFSFGLRSLSILAIEECLPCKDRSQFLICFRAISIGISRMKF
jgi:hypothetical protein